MLLLLALVVGLSLSIMAAQPITKTLVNNASASNTTQTQVPGSGMRMNRPGNLAGSALRSAKDVQTSILEELYNNGNNYASWSKMAEAFGKAMYPVQP